MAHLPEPPERGDEFATHAIRMRGSRTAVVAAAAIVLFVAAAVMKPWSGGAGSGPVPSPPPTRSAAAAVATASAATASPTTASAGNPCAGGTVLVSPGGEPPPRVDLPPISLSRTGRVALVLPGSIDANVGGTHDDVVVAAASGARTVATVMLGGPAGSGWAEVRSWSPDGSVLLVAAGHSSPEDPAANCGDVFLVQADGTRVVRLTDNGPGQAASGGVFLPDGRSMAFLESDRSEPLGALADVRIVPFAGPPSTYWRVPCRVPVPGGPDAEGLLAASSDGAKIVLRCANGATLFEVASRRSTAILLGVRPPAAVGWSRDGAALVLEDPVATGRRPLEIDRSSLLTLAPTIVRTAAELWDTAPGRAAFSPDGKHLVAQACVVTGIPFNCQQDVFSIDVATGAATLIYARQPLLSTGQIIWLPDGSGVAISDGGTGSLYLRPDRQAPPIRSSLPVSAVWWAPPAPGQ